MFKECGSISHCGYSEFWRIMLKFLPWCWRLIITFSLWRAFTTLASSESDPSIRHRRCVPPWSCFVFSSFCVCAACGRRRRLCPQGYGVQALRGSRLRFNPDRKITRSLKTVVMQRRFYLFIYLFYGTSDWRKGLCPSRLDFTVAPFGSRLTSDDGVS